VTTLQAVIQLRLRQVSWWATLSHPDRRRSLIKRIPKAARPACAALLVEVIRAVLKAPTLAKNWSDLLCSEDRPAPCSVDTLAALTLTHPLPATDRRPATVPSSSSQLNALQVSDVHVSKAIRSFPAGSAGVPDGITPQHIKDLTLLQAPGISCELTTNLTNLVNLLLNGELPEYVREVIFEGSLIALQKKNDDIRPIAVGYTLRRLAAMCTCVIGSPTVASLAPLQLGVGVPGGAEAAIHATRRYVSNMPADHVIIKLDFKNAFNSLRRDAMLEAVERDVPEFCRFAHAADTVEPLLQYGNDTVKSREGPEQSDPLGPLMFCITIKPLLRLLQSALRIEFLDDLTIGGQLDNEGRRDDKKEKQIY